MASHRKASPTHKACLQVAVLVVMLLVGGQGGYALPTPSGIQWQGQDAHYAFSFGLGHDFDFIDYIVPFFNPANEPLQLSHSLTQQYCLYGSSRQKNPFHRSMKYNIDKYLEFGFGLNVLHRSNQGKSQQQTQVINKADSSVRIVSAIRDVDVSNLSIGFSGFIDLPTYIIDKLRLRMEVNANMIVWDKSRNVLSLTDNDSSVVFPNIANTSYSSNGRVANRESSGDKTYGMVYTLKFGISYSIHILLRETPWFDRTKQYGEIQPYINYTLTSAPILSNSHRAISGLQFGLRFTIPYEVFTLDEEIGIGVHGG